MRNPKVQTNISRWRTFFSLYQEVFFLLFQKHYAKKATKLKLNSMHTFSDLCSSLNTITKHSFSPSRVPAQLECDVAWNAALPLRSSRSSWRHLLLVPPPQCQRHQKGDCTDFPGGRCLLTCSIKQPIYIRVQPSAAKSNTPLTAFWRETEEGGEEGGLTEAVIGNQRATQEGQWPYWFHK